jgi:hypothetical protein
MFDPSKVRVRGPLASYAPGFIAELADAGYTPFRRRCSCDWRPK